jgi:hypothetical protein
VVSVPSTIIVEACLFRKPLFVLNFGMGQEQRVSSLLGLPPDAFRELQVAKDLQQGSDPSNWTEIFNSNTQNLGRVCSELIFVPEEGSSIQIVHLLAKLAV